MGIGTRMFIGGALQGLGAGMVAQGQQNAEQRRQLALEGARAQNQAAKDGRDAAAALENDARDADNEKTKLVQQYGLIDVNNARQVERETSKTLIVDNNKSDLQKDVDKAKTNNDAWLEGVKSKHRVSEEGMKQATDLRNDLTKLGKEVGKEEVAADGSMVIYSKTGVMLGRTKPGVFVPRAAGDDEPDTVAGLRDARNSGTPAPAPKAAPAAAPKAKDPPKAPPGKTYSQADAIATATKNGVSIDAVHARMRQAGYKLSPN